jgi:hypothetical protein
MRLGDSNNYRDKYYGSSVNENNQTDESPGLGIASRSFGGSSYQQSPAWDTNQGSTGTREPLGLPGWNDRQPINGEDNPGRPSVLKGIVKSPESVAPESPMDFSSSDYSASSEGTISPQVDSNPLSSKDVSTMTPEQYITFLFSRDSISHNPYKGKE